MTKEQNCPEEVSISSNNTKSITGDGAPKKNSAIEVAMFMDYESGNMTDEETIVFFQRLINNGTCWELQGHYGRMAAYFIKKGVCNEAVPRND